MNKNILGNPLMPYQDKLVAIYPNVREKNLLVTEIYYDYKGKLDYVGVYWHEPDGKTTKLS